MVRESPIPVAGVERLIIEVRGHRVMLDEDLAGLYRVQTRELVQAVKRNASRFPGDFMFRLSSPKVVNLRSRIVISSRAHGGRRVAPLAFTEQGVAMLSSVLRSPRAVQVNIEIMRAFVRLRRLLLEHADLARKLAALEKKYDGQFRVVFEAIRELMEPASEPEPGRRIGFGSDATLCGSPRRGPTQQGANRG